MFGQYLGTGAAAAQGDQGAAAEPARRSRRTRTPTSQAQLIFAGCLGKTLAQCRPQSEGGTLGHDTFAAGSAYIATTLERRPRRARSSRVIDARQAAGGSGVLLLDAQGGAIDDAAAGQTSFIHRDMRSSVQILSYGTLAGMAERAALRRQRARRAWRRSATARPTRTTPTRT